jgi:hypothetical protein
MDPSEPASELEFGSHEHRLLSAISTEMVAVGTSPIVMASTRTR